MDNPKTIRLNDADRPDRRADFESAVRRTAVNGNEIIRRLVDAWMLYVQEHGHSPPFPVRLRPEPREQNPRLKPRRK
jgi:hypothetical protein